MIFIPDSDTQAGREGDHGQEDDAELGVGLEGGEHAEQTAPLRASHNCLSSSLQRLLPSPRPPPLFPLPGYPPRRGSIFRIHVCCDFYVIIAPQGLKSKTALRNLNKQILMNRNRFMSIYYSTDGHKTDTRHLGSDQFVLDVRWTFVGYQGW